MKLLKVRLTDVEMERLEAIRGSNNRSEFVRFILAKEHNHRKGSGKPNAETWQSAHRIGRPKLIKSV